MSARERQDLLVEDYGLIENSFERFQLIVDTAHSTLAPYPEEFRTDDRLVPGCVSRVWLAVRESDDWHFTVMIDSEAPALKSIGVLFCRVYSGATAREIRETEPDFIERLAIDRHLTPTRLRGVSQIRKVLLELVTNPG